ncbi:hypothetical protein BGP75_16650 [Motiliproteus sp. MSK22-1]|nr:hypothetical protein BGP75_16650 [Motiliproteus sp. MSK22-1]
MGITCLDEVTRYTLKQNQGADELKIYFQRNENSILPQSTKFSFTSPTTDSTAANDGPAIDTTLLSAISELDNLTRNKQPDPHNKEQLMNELNQFETVVIAKIEELRANLQQW